MRFNVKQIGAVKYVALAAAAAAVVLGSWPAVAVCALAVFMHVVSTPDAKNPLESKVDKLEEDVLRKLEDMEARVNQLVLRR